MIGIILLQIGTITFFPINFLYLISFELTAIAVSPKIVSGLVVAITKKSSESLIGYFKWYKVESTSL